MRPLRIVGLEDDGRTVILEDSARSERFSLPADERLKAAARGDVTRLGQIATELESQMRPREIQARIRAGESVEQVAAAAGLPEHRVERFAYPVLLERSRTAELAQRAHPVREDGPDVQTLGEVVAHAFSTRGQDYSVANWDSWRGEDGKWVVQIVWSAGRSENRAHWAFHPGAHGGTVTPLDDHALDLLDPNSTRPLRTVRPVTELAQQALDVKQPARPQTERQAVNGGEPPRRPAAPEPETRTDQDYVQDFELTQEPQAVTGTREQVGVMDPTPPAPSTPPRPSPPPQRPVPTPPRPTPPPPPPHRPAPTEQRPAEPEPAAEPAAPAPAPPPAAAEPTPAPAAATARRGKGKKARPMVPSWEDVLLGTRSNRG